MAGGGGGGHPHSFSFKAQRSAIMSLDMTTLGVSVFYLYFTVLTMMKR